MLGFQRPLAIRGLPRDGGGDVVAGDARVVSEDAPDTDLISWSCIRRESSQGLSAMSSSDARDSTDGSQGTRMMTHPWISWA